MENSTGGITDLHQSQVGNGSNIHKAKLLIGDRRVSGLAGQRRRRKVQGRQGQNQNVQMKKALGSPTGSDNSLAEMQPETQAGVEEERGRATGMSHLGRRADVCSTQSRDGLRVVGRADTMLRRNNVVLECRAVDLGVKFYLGFWVCPLFQIVIPPTRRCLHNSYSTSSSSSSAIFERNPRSARGRGSDWLRHILGNKWQQLRV